MIVTKPDRLARSTLDLLQIAQKLQGKTSCASSSGEGGIGSTVRRRHSHLQAPAEGLWRQGQKSSDDDIVVFEVMTDTIQLPEWRTRRAELEHRFRQDVLLKLDTGFPRPEPQLATGFDKLGNRLLVVEAIRPSSASGSTPAFCISGMAPGVKPMNLQCAKASATKSLAAASPVRRSAPSSDRSRTTASNSTEVRRRSCVLQG